MADVRPIKRSGRICAAIGCHNTTYNSDVCLFRFPNEKDKDRSTKWVINSRQADLGMKTPTQLYNNY
ncbi:hypothetical protein LSAT2_023134 [Lamellibrachia satsuma]|nr:hypothetical protein LSAT2_023134 [Lamellibrachia satsuma]